MHRCHAKYQLRLLMEEDFWKQKAAVRWVAEGERNTRFFQGFVRQKRAKSYIHSIEADGSSLTQESQIRESAVAHFQTLFTSDRWSLLTLTLFAGGPPPPPPLAASRLTSLHLPPSYPVPVHGPDPDSSCNPISANSAHTIGAIFPPISSSSTYITASQGSPQLSSDPSVATIPDLGPSRDPNLPLLLGLPLLGPKKLTGHYFNPQPTTSK
ncbi:3-bisphosphoglycerate-dependent phosphoglyceratemutase [Striga asiatica]|uniref:3-bisphosphoglycerate-dependent phosphoglyceratemutase n=1 Tax=Striga asiatica TaxID=4170 RepID=A0A5A7PLH8_STRAF|nr:3-bisphosphoglycerate-dependent phosphoglyceratemutase [Striga asiatica]